MNLLYVNEFSDLMLCHGRVAGAAPDVATRVTPDLAHPPSRLAIRVEDILATTSTQWPTYGHIVVD